MATDGTRHGGDLVARVLARWGVRQLYTLCGGHISPLLVGAEDAGLDVIDCRDERSVVFAADAASRMTGIPGVAAVTAGPGVTNTITAVKNAQLAQSPVVILGGATATVLSGRGALQDIDQMALIRSAVKWSSRCTTVASLEPTVERALAESVDGVPGPVFVEIPVDVLYPESVVREWYRAEGGLATARTMRQRALGLYLEGHLARQFRAPHVDVARLIPARRSPVASPESLDARLEEAAAAVRRAERPALVVGSQTTVGLSDADQLAAAVQALGVPTWLGGSARGLLGTQSQIQFRHARGKALKEADVVVVAGFPFDFRLKYGRGLGRDTFVIAANLSGEELTRNRKPHLAFRQNAAGFLITLADRVRGGRWGPWLETCRRREQVRDAEIAAAARTDGDLVDPIHFFQRLDAALEDESVLVMDGGDFVATGSYILRPRHPLSWLDPGVFGTLGVGGGFAVGAAATRPDSQVWIVYGDGASAYSLSEFDTFVRHGMAPIAVVGTDASWHQIARDQSTLLGSDVGTTLRRTDYQKVAEGYGGVGLLLDHPAKVDDVLAEAKSMAARGRPVCVNVHLAPTGFREGSISI